MLNHMLRRTSWNERVRF